MQSLLGDNPLSYLACLTRCTRKASAVDKDSMFDNASTSPDEKVCSINFKTALVNENTPCSALLAYKARLIWRKYIYIYINELL